MFLKIVRDIRIKVTGCYSYEFLCISASPLRIDRSKIKVVDNRNFHIKLRLGFEGLLVYSLTI